MNCQVLYRNHQTSNKRKYIVSVPVSFRIFLPVIRSKSSIYSPFYRAQMSLWASWATLAAYSYIEMTVAQHRHKDMGDAQLSP